MAKPCTVSELRKSGYKVLSVREEMRKNLISKMERDEPLFKNIFGYDDTVIPQVENAILAGQDIIFLGERGQAKSRIIRGLVTLLDDEIPIIKGCEINDNPFNPLCRPCREKTDKQKGRTGIVWVPRDQRYAEKLATPDITMADLIGEIDPIRVAEGRYLSDEHTIHYGLVPRTNRGVFCINELPDLAERIQVGLFNLMEEGDVQIKGYRIRLPLDVYVVASANPEDYTNRGRIITPLKDRYGAQIRTHYPLSPDIEVQIMEIERRKFDDGRTTLVPQFMKDIIAEVTAVARRTPDINQRSGVSVRISTANYEGVISNALRRAIRNREKTVTPRISDLPYISSSTIGKLELEMVEDDGGAKVLDGLIKRAVVNVFNRYFSVEDFGNVVQKFKAGLTFETSDSLPSKSYSKGLKYLDGMNSVLEYLDCEKEPATKASALEFVLEGLHLNRRLNKEKREGRYMYKTSPHQSIVLQEEE